MSPQKVGRRSYGRHIALLLSLLIVAGALLSCSKGDTGYTLCIYMCGSNLETKKGAAGKNIDELLAASIPSDVSVVIQTGGAQKWRSHDIPSDSINRWKVENGELVLLESLPQANMGSEETLADFITYCAKSHAGSRLCLVLWDHGGGSASGICYDENYRMDALSLSELDEALSEAGKSMKKNFFFIGYDLCLAANFETALITSKYADHMVASQEIEPFGGWDYTPVVENLGSESYFDDILSAYSGKCMRNGHEAYTLSHIDLRDFDKVSKSFNGFVDKLRDISGDSLKSVVDAANESMSFGLNAGVEGYSNMIDLPLFARLTGADEFADTIDGYVTSVNGRFREQAGGISIYYPTAGLDGLYAYIDRSPCAEYTKFLEDNYGSITQNELISFTDRGSDEDGELHIELTEESMKYIQRVEYRVYQYYTRSDGYSRWISHGSDTDINPSGATGFVTSCEGKWIKFGDYFVCCYPIDKTGSLSTFCSTCRLNGEAGTVRFTYDISTRKFHTIGFIPASEEGGTGRMSGIKVGDTLRVMFYELLNDGTERMCDGMSAEYTGNEHFHVVVAPDGEYQMYIIVTDIFGNQYTSDVSHFTLEDGVQKIWKIDGELCH